MRSLDLSARSRLRAAIQYRTGGKHAREEGTSRRTPRAVKISLRITAELKEGLEAIADADQRSLAATIERILQAHVAGQQQLGRKRR